MSFDQRSADLLRFYQLTGADVEIILHRGSILFGEPTPEQQQFVRGMKNNDRLHSIFRNLCSASSWDELLNASHSPPPSS